MPVHAFVHVTGGGIPGNLVRVLPNGTIAWSLPVGAVTPPATLTPGMAAWSST